MTVTGSPQDQEPERDPAAGQGQGFGQGQDHGPSTEVAFQLNLFKLRILAVVTLAGAAWFLAQAISGLSAAQDAGRIAAQTAAEAAQSAPGPSPLVTGLIAAAFALIALWLWRQASDRRPLLIVGPEGLEDRTFGRIPWEDVRAYRMVSSFFSPGFGYSLRKGARPGRLAGLYRFQSAMNLLSNMPQRCFRKQMVVGGCDPMLAAFRLHRPDLEGK